ncbi:MAG: hypothetical protein FWH18_08270 [Marinilabiliaceae bacterium]|nr:hypothetical protein [Marinilabiliaceae bacterium]
MNRLTPEGIKFIITLAIFEVAIINALPHRNYYEKGAVTMIEIFDLDYETIL